MPMGGGWKSMNSGRMKAFVTLSLEDVVDEELVDTLADVAFVGHSSP